jgi:hypothetical protein
VSDLERAIKVVDPAAFLVEPRILRRVIRHDRDLGLFEVRSLPRNSYVIDARDLLSIVDRDELGIVNDEDLAPAEMIILMAKPDPAALLADDSGRTVIHYWRLLFQAHIESALRQRIASGALTPAQIRSRVDRIGQANFDEIRSVLALERYVTDPRDVTAVYVQFATVFLDLRYFEPRLLPRYFPSLTDDDAVEAVLAEDLDVPQLLAGSRIEGAPELVAPPNEIDEPATEVDSVDVADEPVTQAPEISAPVYQKLIRESDRVGRLGNLVRAAILRMRAIQFAPPGKAEPTRAAALRTLKRMVVPLQPALELTDEQVRVCRVTLPLLLERAARGRWSAEARLLYDLQKVAIDHARDVSTIDVVGWAFSFGRRPLKRVLPNHREVSKLRNLRTATRRLRRVHVDDPTRERLSELFAEIIAQTEDRLRERFSPLIARTLERTGWKPSNMPERVALHKLNGELLDRIVDRGFLAFGDLRDAVSRNDLKLADLAGPKELWNGDRLLRTDRKLAIALDGVYRRGEIYLRGLQKASSLAFGTRAGRLITRYALLPFGGAFVLLKGLQHLVGELIHWLYGVELHFDNKLTLIIFGLVFLGLINLAEFRSRMLESARRIFLAGRWVVRDVPAWILSRPLIRQIASSRAFGLAWRWGAKPLIATIAIMAFVSPLAHLPAVHATWGGVGVFVSMALLLNTRAGRDVQETAVDRLLHVLHQLRSEIIPGAFHMIMDASDRALETVERVIYTIDESLRFKSDQGKLNYLSKAVLGTLWGFITYLARIYINLLIEPQVNPIKHFPVVTVSHKVMLPYSGTLLGILRVPFLPLGFYWANALAGVNLLLLPGFFGFLVWELKSNWRLYEKNRPRNLGPVVIGHHGETMARLLRPGFHSGTVPKLFAKLRRAERKSHPARRVTTIRAALDALHHVEAEVRRFVDRELLVLLRESQRLGTCRIQCDEVHVGSNQIRIELEDQNRKAKSLWLAFEEQSGWLVASVPVEGWLSDLPEDSRRAVINALGGGYKLAGANLVREQIEAALGPALAGYDICDEGLVVWPTKQFDREFVFDLRTGSITPQSESLPLRTKPDVDALVFARHAIPWDRWVQVWEPDTAERVLPDVVLLERRPTPQPIARKS